MNLVCRSNDTQAEHARIRELNAASQAARQSRKQISDTFSRHKATSVVVPSSSNSTSVGIMDLDCYRPDSLNIVSHSIVAGRFECFLAPSYSSLLSSWSYIGNAKRCVSTTGD